MAIFLRVPCPSAPAVDSPDHNIQVQTPYRVELVAPTDQTHEKGLMVGGINPAQFGGLALRLIHVPIPTHIIINT